MSELQNDPKHLIEKPKIQLKNDNMHIISQDPMKGYEFYTMHCSYAFKDTHYDFKIDLRRLYKDSLEEDVNARDFSINAICYLIDKKEIVDLVGGTKDLADKVVRCVTTPKKVFKSS